MLVLLESSRESKGKFFVASGWPHCPALGWGDPRGFAGLPAVPVVVAVLAVVAVGCTPRCEVLGRAAARFHCRLD